MTLDRRQVLAGGGALVASCAGGARETNADDAPLVDWVLEANAVVLPERAGAGANHYPMAAEALESLGRPELVEVEWRSGAARYGSEVPRVEPIGELETALGNYPRYGDWLDLFRDELASGPWRAVLARWIPRLTPGISAAVFHGVIRTAHAVRALERRDTRARRDELAAALAYWAARYEVLLVDVDAPPLRAPLSARRNAFVDEIDDVPFHGVRERLARGPIAPPVTIESSDAPADVRLDHLLHEAAESFLEMLVQERHRIWLLHTVTAPAAASLLVPYLDETAARNLAAHCRQSVIALFVAFGAPYTPGNHLRSTTPPWPDMIDTASRSRSVHTIKLVEALSRYRHVDDPLYRSVASQWLEWT